MMTGAVRLRILLISLLMSLMPIAAVCRAEDRGPAGYVADIALQGADANAGTAVIRDGEEMKPKLMMPLFDGDVVFVRDPRSRIELELDGGQTVVVGDGRSRHMMAGEIDTGDGTWGLIAALGNVFAGEDEPAPENMVSKGGDLKVAMALRTGNMVLREQGALWLGWTGGTAPYAIGLVVDGAEREVVSGLQNPEASVPIAHIQQGMFTLIVHDARQQRVRIGFRFGDAMPEFPSAMERLLRTKTRDLALAAWLTTVGNGRWTVQAAQILQRHASSEAEALLKKLTKGWTLDLASR